MKNKYKNISRRIDGYYFRSLKEARYYCELKLRVRAGDIVGFGIQPKYKFPCGITYVADFKILHNDGSFEIIDVKGKQTYSYKLKKKMFKHHYPKLKFREV